MGLAQNVEDLDYDEETRDDWFEGNPPGWDIDDEGLIDPQEWTQEPQEYQEEERKQEERTDEDDLLEFSSINALDFDPDSEPDWYALGYDASKSGYSQCPPSYIFDSGHSAVALWNQGYHQSVEDRMENIGIKGTRKNVRKGIK